MSRHWASGRIFLAAMGLLALALVAALGATTTRLGPLVRGVLDALPQGLVLGGAFLAFALGLALWSVLRPARAGAPIAYAAVAVAAGGPVATFAWKVPPPPAATMRVLNDVHSANVVTALRAGLLFSFGASLLLGVSALAFARRARRAGEPRISVRAALVGVGGLVLAGLLVRLAVSMWRAILEWAVVPLVLEVLVLATVCTVRDATAEARGDALRAVALATFGLVLAVLVAGIDDAGPLPSGGYVVFSERAVARSAVVLVIPLALAPVSVRVRGAWSALRAVAAPLAGVAVAFLAGVVLSRGALAAPRHDGGPWPALPPGLAAADACADVVPSAVVRVRDDAIHLPQEAGGVDAARAVSWLDAQDPSRDAFLAVESSAAYGVLADLLTALGRARGVRAVGATAVTEPLEGCAFVLVGDADGATACSRPIPLAWPCAPKLEEWSPVWNVTLDGSAHGSHVWTRGGQPYPERRDFAVANLAEVAREAWILGGAHRNPYDARFDVAMLRAPRSVPVGDVLRAAAAILSVRRDYRRPSGTPGRRWRAGPLEQRSVFTLVLDVAP